MELRKQVPYGYILANGQAMTDYSVDRYNATQDRINAFIKAGLPVPEIELNDSHQQIAILLSMGEY